MIRSLLLLLLLLVSCDRKPPPPVATPSPTPEPAVFEVVYNTPSPSPTATPSIVWLGQKLEAESTPRVVELGIRDDGFVVWRDPVSPTPTAAPSVEIDAIGTPAPSPH